MSAKREALKSEEKELQSRLIEFSCTEMGHFKERLAEKRKLESRQGELQGSLDGALGGKDKGSLEEEWRQIRSELRGERDWLEDPQNKAARLNPLDLAKLKREVDELGANRDRLKDTRDLLSAEVRVSKISSEDVAFLEEKKEGLEEKLAREKKKLAVLKLLFESLTQARLETIAEGKDILRERVQEYFSEMTLGAYKQVEVDGNLNFRSCVGGTDHWEQPQSLSRGTIDQFYLAARLALANILSGGKRHPLLLDDPLVSFDVDRLESTRKLLEYLAAEQQVILFTCRLDYDNWGNLIDL